ncbi:hypothetical protein [Nonomuraea cavernae]|uniref:hypothetical protein n=1 Tax=Nonomuraea cavernae TaxID=2045107 RepID=UPI0036110C65
MASAAGDGSSHHRPPTVGGPVLLGSTARRRRVVAGRCAGRPDPSVARSGASVSPDTRPDHTRSHRAVASAGSSSEPSWSDSPRKNSAPPPPSTSSTWVCSGVMVISAGSGSSRGAVSAKKSDTHPSPPGSEPWPTHITSPDEVSSSSSAGW